MPSLEPRVFVFLIGAAYIFYQVHAAENYIAELMVESNVTLEAKTILSILNGNVLEVTGHEVIIVTATVVAECVIYGDQFACNCSDGYIWSNNVCYSHKCCQETTCKQNVSHIAPLCIAKVEVHINGSVMLNEGSWDSTKTTALVTAFKGLNGFEYLNVTGLREGNSTVDFEAAVSVKFITSRLQDIVTSLENRLRAVLWVDTVGMVTMEAPKSTVLYLSSPELKCKFEEETGSSGWNMSTKYKRSELNMGSVVKLNHNCSTQKYKSCVEVKLQNVTGIWEGTYECGFTQGSVRHTAKTQLCVALLPDAINLKINPLTVDCSQSSTTVDVSATILNSTESFNVSGSYRGKEHPVSKKSDGDNLVYSFTVSVSCQKTKDPQSVKVTFINTFGQSTSETVDIPVIYVGEKFCSEEVINGDVWPKTPNKDTVINQTCPEGRTGFKSRTCDHTWQQVYYNCVNQKLIHVFNNADNFLKGLAATETMAMDIFQGLRNESTFASDTDSIETTADIGASIHILNVMSRASAYVDLKEDIFPNMVYAASNMLNKSWDGVNKSIIHNMSSNYLQSVEGLVKNTKVNARNSEQSQNLELKFCSGDCNVNVFDISVNINNSVGLMKTVAVKNLTDKLGNNIGQTRPIDLLISATLEYNESPIEIILDFPVVNSNKPLCVFWNTTDRSWSDTGCIVNRSDSNNTVCKCNHLTSFSVLMAKSDISTDVLDIITSVGLGMSICCLLIFLIIESLVWSAVVKSNLSHFRHTALANIATFLLLGDCCFLISTSPETIGDEWCLILTACKHLFFLAMFSWMLCMSVMLVHQLIFVFTPLRKRVFMFFSSIIGYVFPILIVGSSFVYSKYTDKSYHNSKTCWLSFERFLEGSIHAFILPVGTIILTNFFSMAVVIITLTKSSFSDSSKANDKETAKSILKVVVFLTPVFGLTWIIGFGLLMLEEHSPVFTVANYSFTILNSFQGVLILITGCFAEKRVREELFKLIMVKAKGKSESMKNLTSTTFTTDK